MLGALLVAAVQHGYAAARVSGEALAKRVDDNGRQEGLAGARDTRTNERSGRPGHPSGELGKL